MPGTNLTYAKTALGRFSVGTLLAFYKGLPERTLSSRTELKLKPSALYNGAWTQQALDTSGHEHIRP